MSRTIDEHTFESSHRFVRIYKYNSQCMRLSCKLPKNSAAAAYYIGCTKLKTTLRNPDATTNHLSRPQMPCLYHWCFRSPWLARYITVSSTHTSSSTRGFFAEWRQNAVFAYCSKPVTASKPSFKRPGVINSSDRAVILWYAMHGGRKEDGAHAAGVERSCSQ